MSYGYYPGPTHDRYYYAYYGPYYGRLARSDADIDADVRSRLIDDSWVDAEQVNTAVHDGVVTLSGEVDSVVEKRAAGDDAWDTLGVADVSNRLRVRRRILRR